MKNLKINLENKTWGILTENEKEELIQNSNCINGVDGTKVTEGECIVDFNNSNYSIIGKIVNDELIIADDAEFYNPVQ